MSYPVLVKTLAGSIVATDTRWADFDASGAAIPAELAEKIHVVSDSRVVAGWGVQTRGFFDCNRSRWAAHASVPHVDLARRIAEDFAAAHAPRFAEMPVGTGWCGWLVSAREAVRIGVNADGVFCCKNVWSPSQVGITLPDLEPAPPVKALVLKHGRSLPRMPLREAADLAVQLVQGRLDWAASHPPEKGRLYGGPISCVVLERFRPVRWIRQLAEVAA